MALSFLKIVSVFAVSMMWTLAQAADSGPAPQATPINVPALLSALPQFEGSFITGEAVRRAMGTDFGYDVHKFPFGVLEPKTVRDIQKVVVFAGQYQMKVTMRGIGGAAYGQTQWEDGITIDSTSFKTMNFVTDKAGNTMLDVRPGALWSDVVDFAMTRNLAPAVLPDTLQISVGGTLSVGGIGETSYRLGAQVDHVTELDIVTADGVLHHCSATKNSELFHRALGGMGQFGIIVRARIQLLQAPPKVQVRQLKYAATDIAQFMTDHATIASMEAAGAIAGDFNKNADGTWTPELTVTTWGADSANPAWLKNVKGIVTGPVQEMSFHDYLHRNTAGYLAGQKSGAIFIPHPYLSFFVDEEKGLSIVQQIFADPASTLGAAKIAIFDEDADSFGKQNSFSLPKTGKRYVHIRIYRKSPQSGTQDHAKMLASNKDWIQKILDAGGTLYLPFSPLLTQAQFVQQFGADAWAEMIAAKKIYDPQLMLAPGVQMFDANTLASVIVAPKCEFFMTP